MQPQRYVPKRISELSDNDTKVAIVGNVVSSNGNMFTVEDGSGSAEIFSESPVNTGSVSRFFCTSIDGRLKADIVQSLNGFDLILYNKIKSLGQRLGV